MSEVMPDQPAPKLNEQLAAPEAASRSRRKVVATCAAVAVAFTAGATLWPDGSGERRANANAPVNAAGLPGDAQEVTDADLRQLDRSDYNCGGHLQKPDKKGHYSGDYAVDYYNANPELGEEMDAFHTATLGSGFDVLLSHGYTNSDTAEGKHFASNTKIDTLLRLRARVKLDKPRIYANFSCKKGNEFDIHRATKKPTIAIQPGSHVEGVLLDEEGLKAFKENVKRNEDGSLPVDVVDTGDHKIGNETKQLWLVALYADGCDNPVLRLQPPKKVEPTTPTSTKLPTPTPSRTLPPMPTRTPISGKTDNAENPGDGNDSDQDDGIPGNPGEGDAGQEPDPNGHVPGEKTPTPQPPYTPEPTPRPTTSPGPAPTTGGPQPSTPPRPPRTHTPPPPTATPTKPNLTS